MPDFRYVLPQVCGKRGHNAGFMGALYLDCPNKPCYLCKKPGHTTATCPYRIAPEHGCIAASSVSDHSLFGSIFKREMDGRYGTTLVVLGRIP